MSECQLSQSQLLVPVSAEKRRSETHKKQTVKENCTECLNRGQFLLLSMAVTKLNMLINVSMCFKQFVKFLFTSSQSFLNWITFRNGKERVVRCIFFPSRIPTFVLFLLCFVNIFNHLFSSF